MEGSFFGQTIDTSFHDQKRALVRFDEMSGNLRALKGNPCSENILLIGIPAGRIHVLRLPRGICSSPNLQACNPDAPVI